MLYVKGLTRRYLSRLTSSTQHNALGVQQCCIHVLSPLWRVVLHTLYLTSAPSVPEASLVCNLSLPLFLMASFPCLPFLLLSPSLGWLYFYLYFFWFFLHLQNNQTLGLHFLPWRKTMRNELIQLPTHPFLLSRLSSGGGRTHRIRSLESCLRLQAAGCVKAQGRTCRCCRKAIVSLHNLRVSWLS